MSNKLQQYIHNVFFNPLDDLGTLLHKIHDKHAKYAYSEDEQKNIKRITEYRIVSNIFKDELSDEINKNLSEGFVLYKDLKVECDSINKEHFVYIQEMVKYK